jgi:hypothetical protein
MASLFPLRDPAGAALAALLLAATGCRVAPATWQDGADDRLAAREYGAEQQRAWDELNELKAELAWEHDDPLVWSAPGHGEVLVRRWYLEGGVDWEYVRAKFTYRNTTGQPLDHVKVILSVLDPHGRVVCASRVRLVHPWGVPLGRDTLFSDEISTPTLGAHLRRGWQWRLDVEAVPWEPAWPRAVVAGDAAPGPGRRAF